MLSFWWENTEKSNVKVYNLIVFYICIVWTYSKVWVSKAWNKLVSVKRINLIYIPRISKVQRNSFEINFNKYITLYIHQLSIEIYAACTYRYIYTFFTNFHYYFLNSSFLRDKQSISELFYSVSFRLGSSKVYGVL